MEGFQNPKTGPQRRGFPRWGLEHPEELRDIRFPPTEGRVNERLRGQELWRVESGVTRKEAGVP